MLRPVSTRSYKAEPSDDDLLYMMLEEEEEAAATTVKGGKNSRCAASPNEKRKKKSRDDASSHVKVTLHRSVEEEALPPPPTAARTLNILPHRVESTTTVFPTSPPPTAAAAPTTTSTTTPAPGTLSQAYETLLEESYINPFNGRRLHIQSKLALLLRKLGFVRSTENPLFLTWLPRVYLDLIASTRATLDAKARQRYVRQQQKVLKGEPSPTTGPPPPLAPPAAVTTEDALSVVLRSLERRPGKRASSSLGAATPAAVWTQELSELLRSPDAITEVPRHLAQRYADLTTGSVMPAKLDATSSDDVLRQSQGSAHEADGPPITLTPDQTNVLQLTQRGYSVFIGGNAGTGKTVLLRQVYRVLSRMGLRVAMTATTGVAAVQLGGCTFHHAFKAPIYSGSLSLVSSELWSRRWDQAALKGVDVVMIDEVSLLDAQTLDAFDMEARIARMCPKPFGGIQIVACGDFMQLSIGVQDALPAFMSEAFRSLLKVRLETPMRHRAGDPLLPLLNKLRRGEYDGEQFGLLDKPLPPPDEDVTFIFPRRREAQRLNEKKLNDLVTTDRLFAPQRGPLRLSGVFTASALVDCGSASIPSRSRVITVLRECLHAMMLRGGDRSSEEERGEPASAAQDAVAADELTSPLAEVDVVVMPLQSGRSFFLRVRLPDIKCSASELQSSASAGMTIGPRRSRAGAGLAALLTRERWEALATACAHRLSARVTSFFEEEPRSLIPLSVSMSLADMTDNDIAHALAPLRLKLGCRVMVTRNLSRTVSNGSVGTVEAFADPDPSLYPQHSSNSFRQYSPLQQTIESECFDRLPVVRLNSGAVVQIPASPVHIGGSPLTYYYGHDIYSVPLQLGYAFTVHKVQGLTLQGKVVLDCKNFFDCPHLVYVACSRVTSLDQLYVKNIKEEMVMVKESALEFSDKLLPASNMEQLSNAENQVAKGVWTLSPLPSTSQMTISGPPPAPAAKTTAPPPLSPSRSPTNNKKGTPSTRKRKSC